MLMINNRVRCTSAQRRCDEIAGDVGPNIRTQHKEKENEF
jgi:hypothetical protein